MESNAKCCYCQEVCIFCSRYDCGEIRLYATLRSIRESPNQEQGENQQFANGVLPNFIKKKKKNPSKVSLVPIWIRKDRWARQSVSSAAREHIRLYIFTSAGEVGEEKEVCCSRAVIFAVLPWCQ